MPATQENTMENKKARNFRQEIRDTINNPDTSTTHNNQLNDRTGQPANFNSNTQASYRNQGRANKNTTANGSTTKRIFDQSTKEARDKEAKQKDETKKEVPENNVAKNLWDKKYQIITKFCYRTIGLAWLGILLDFFGQIKKFLGIDKKTKPSLEEKIEKPIIIMVALFATLTLAVFIIIIVHIYVNPPDSLDIMFQAIKKIMTQ
ncbi:MAG: hypothetical protein JW816_02180 [Candidatus Buchananbacteria bacterium]|nr:hypothetical protein [Candidatus Buchananbacteria bacterium]